jgi:ankyrin repeat protein
LKEAVEARAPLAVRLERLLAAIREDRGPEAERLLAQDPSLARSGLAVACALGDTEFVASALASERGLAAHSRLRRTWPLLAYACASPFHTRDSRTAERIAAVVTLLLDAGVNPNEPIVWAADEGAPLLPPLYFACARGNTATARVMLERGADPNDGESIYHAAEHDHRPCLELLLQHGADVSGRHAVWGNTPLYFLLGYVEGAPGTPAADAGIRWLLEHGANPEVTSTLQDETALHCAARVGRAEPMLSLLLAHGADPSRSRADGATPYALALRHGNAETAAALAAAGADTSRVNVRDRFLAACLAGDGPAASELLGREPALLSEQEAEALGALATAAGRGHVEAVRLMLELGFPPDGAGPGADTPLHHAAWHGWPACVQLLLERGAPVNVRDTQFGCSPLAWACHGAQNCREADEDYLAVVDQLLSAGADRATAINRWGGKPEEMGRPAIASRLVERGFAPAEDTDDDG